MTFSDALTWPENSFYNKSSNQLGKKSQSLPDIPRCECPPLSQETVCFLQASALPSCSQMCPAPTTTATSHEQYLGDSPGPTTAAAFALHTV